MATAEMDYVNRGGEKKYYESVPITQNAQQIDCGFEPDIITIIGYAYVYSYDRTAGHCYVCANAAWASNVSAGYLDSCISTNSNGFTFSRASATDQGHNAQIFAYKF